MYIWPYPFNYQALQQDFGEKLLAYAEGPLVRKAHTKEQNVRFLLVVKD
jgi:hypothetical protein